MRTTEGRIGGMGERDNVAGGQGDDKRQEEDQQQQ